LGDRRLYREGKAVLREASTSQVELAKQYRIFCYGFFGYSTEIWDFYNDTVLKVRKGERVLRGGLQLATNAMPQGEVVQIPPTRNIGYQNVCHVVIHFTGAEPDLGRKGFQPELEGLGKAIAVLVVNFFLAWRKHLRKETGASGHSTRETPPIHFNWACFCLARRISLPQASVQSQPSSTFWLPTLSL
jgi:hypothetical protein